jgi:transcriptional regulator of nitric oxide reductase
MRQIVSVDVPQEAFPAVLKLDDRCGDPPIIILKRKDILLALFSAFYF